MRISRPFCPDARRVACVVAALGLVLAPVRALAQDVDMTPEARVRFDQGSLLYQEKEYTKALEEFFIGYLIDPQPDFLYTIGQVYRAKGDCGNAVEAYRSYLRTNPPAAKASKAKTLVERCEADPNAGPTEPEALPRAKGPAGSRPCPEPRGGGRGGDVEVKAWYQDWLADSLAVSGVIALGLGGSLWLGGRNSLTTAADPGRYPDHASFQAAVESAKSKQTAGIIVAAAGAGLVSAAILRWMLHDEVVDGQEPTVAPAAKADEEGAMLFLHGSF